MVATTLNGVMLTGDHASRPAASAVAKGTLYSCTTHSLIYQSDASSWSTWATLTGTGLTDPMTTRGDIIIRNASNVTARLAIGSSGKVLSSDGTDVSWQTPSAGGGTNYTYLNPAFVDWTASTGTWARVLQTDTGDSALNSFPGLQNTSNAQNDAKSIDLWMDAGTYTVTVWFRKSSNTGIITVNLDGASQGTIDTYAASPILGSGSVTSISVSAGQRTWQFKMATKNASSSAYNVGLYAIIIRRTA